MQYCRRLQSVEHNEKVHELNTRQIKDLQYQLSLVKPDRVSRFQYNSCTEPSTTPTQHLQRHSQTQQSQTIQARPWQGQRRLSNAIPYSHWYADQVCKPFSDPINAGKNIGQGPVTPASSASEDLRDQDHKSYEHGQSIVEEGAPFTRDEGMGTVKRISRSNIHEIIS